MNKNKKKSEIDKQIAEYVNKSPYTVRDWSTQHPGLYELVVLGAYCKENNLSKEDISTLVKLQNLIKREDLLPNNPTIE